MRRLKKILGRGYYSVVHLYLRLRFWYPVWFYLLNRKGRLAYLKEDFGLNVVERRIVRNLEKDGIAMVHISALFGQDTWKELTRYGGMLSNSARVKKRIAASEAEPPQKKSDIIIHILGGYGDTRPTLNVGDAFIRFATSSTILRIIAGYLKILPKFTMFSLHSTIIMPPRAATVFSQNWHRDPDDMKLVKVFLYLSDVNSKKAGPFMYIRGSQFGGKWRHIFPQKPPMGSYPAGGVVELMVAPGDIMVCTGRAGTLIFCDTSGLHRGGHSVGKRRLMFAGTFVTQAGLASHKPNYKNISKESDMNALSEIARYSLS